MRAEHYERLAQKAESRADAAFKVSEKATEGIVLGQPILVGHHSEAAHRSAIAKSNSAMSRCHNEMEKAAYYRAKAQAAENNTNIYLGDEDAIDRLEAKLEELEKKQTAMKETNKILRSKAEDCYKVEALVELGYSHGMADKIVAEKLFYPTYALTNNNAVINNTRKRLEKAKALAEATDKEYEINDVRVVECYSENRVRVFFEDIPDEATRAKLKSNGFRWSRSNGCWQAYLNRTTVNRLKIILSEL